MSSQCIVAIDTSNYKTSVAAIDKEKNILFDERILLKVKQGEKGLRQSYALFQHIENLPLLIGRLFKTISGTDVKAIAYSDRPRNVEGSYMPVFKAGISFGESLASGFCVPAFAFSHQQGHIEAIKETSGFLNENELLAYHLSGGTCELLKVKEEKIDIIGGSLDISFGQLIDRAGVKLGIQFPCGEEMDKMAQSCEEIPSCLCKLSKIKNNHLYFNLSGVETQILKRIDECSYEKECAMLVKELFINISALLSSITEKAVLETGINKVLFTGGVSSSIFIETQIKDRLREKNIQVGFGNQNYSQDNAVGIAMLGRKKLWL